LVLDYIRNLRNQEFFNIPSDTRLVLVRKHDLALVAVSDIPENGTITCVPYTNVTNAISQVTAVVLLLLT